MSSQQYNSGPTTNDLLESRIAENILAALRDSAGAQVPEDVPNLDNDLLFGALSRFGTSSGT
jgi:hypothetical protein